MGARQVQEGVHTRGSAGRGRAKGAPLQALPHREGPLCLAVRSGRGHQRRDGRRCLLDSCPQHPLVQRLSLHGAAGGGERAQYCVE